MSARRSNDDSIDVAVSAGHTDMGGQSLRKSRLPKWPLTTLLPIAISLAILSVSLVITTIGISILHARNTSALEDKAAVFLDAMAGHVALETTIDRETARTALVNALRFPTVLGEDALALGWTVDGNTEMIYFPAEAPEVHLQQALEMALREMAGPTGFRIDENDRGIYTKVYEHNDEQFAITALFDASEVVDANRTALFSALAINAALALCAALISFGITRSALSPLRAFTERLAHEDMPPETARELSYMSTEIAALETALVLRQQTEDLRSKTLERIAQAERDALLARVAATLAHEVRNPLAGILNAVSTIRRYGEDNAVREETLDIVESGLHSLERIADTTLATYRKRSGRQEVTNEDIVDLKLLITPEARAKNITMAWNVPSDFSFTTDADAIRQILVNLLINACKASLPGGTISLDIRREPDSVQLSVSDDGAGMPAEILAFLQTGASTGLPPTRELGIWVVSELVKDLGARLAVESRAGKGTTVTIIIPADDASEAKE